MKKQKLVFLVLLSVVLLWGCGGGGDGYTPTEAVGGKPVIAPEALQTSFTYPNTTITSVTLKKEGEVTVQGIGPMPEHVVVTGITNERISPVDGRTYAIRWEMRLPTNWNGRFYYQANGGLDGNVVPAYGPNSGGGPTSNALSKGFAVISSDAGHPGTLGGLFGIDPQARIDYGYNTVAVLTPLAKNLIKTYYGKFPDKSYIGGCSNGGRHAMVAASRYADMYDGIIAGNPGFNLPKAALAQIWGAQQYALISDINPSTGRPDISTSVTAAEFKLISSAILAKCDELDGLKDNMVLDVEKCQAAFNIYTDVPTCSGARDGTCLTSKQKLVLSTIMAGARTSEGTSVYANFPWDPGIGGSNWAFWEFVASMMLDPHAVGFVFTTPPQDPSILTSLTDYVLNWTGTGFNIDQDYPKIYATNDVYKESSMSFMTPPDPLMKKLPTTHTKLIVYHGTADAVFSVADTINWYKNFLAYHGKSGRDYARLFLVPQMNHCAGGPSCDQFDMLDAIVNWVEKGIAPDYIVAKARGQGANVVNPEVPATWAPNRTRILCPYPAVAKYDGSGDVESYTSFRCVEP